MTLTSKKLNADGSKSITKHLASDFDYHTIVVVRTRPFSDKRIGSLSVRCARGCGATTFHTEIPAVDSFPSFEHYLRSIQRAILEGDRTLHGRSRGS